MTTVNVKTESTSISNVTIYPDRAEIHRKFAVDVNQGINTIVLQKLPRFFVPDSFVVGASHGKIIDVQVVDIKHQIDNDLLEKLKAKRDEVTKKEKQLIIDKNGINKKLTALDEMISHVSKGIAQPSSGTFSASESNLSNITAFFSFYDRETTVLRSELDKRDVALIEIRNDLTVINHDIVNVECGPTQRNLSITIDSKEQESIEVTVAYQSFNCAWHPKYDVRVRNKGENDGVMGAELELTYFAVVLQCTDEDWEGVPLTLSNEPKDIFTHLPRLSTVSVSVNKSSSSANCGPPPMDYGRGGYGGGYGNKQTDCQQQQQYCPPDDSESLPMVESTIRRNPRELVTLHPLPYNDIIKGDGTHKTLTVDVLKCEAELFYEILPTKYNNSFLMLQCPNEFKLPIQQGEGTVYIDGAYQGNTTIDDDNLNGTFFKCFLRTDTTIRFSRTPTSGMITTAKESEGEPHSIHKEAFLIKNTNKDHSVTVKVTQPIPKSYNNNIKVEVIEKSPDKLNESKGKIGVILLPNNFIQWNDNIPPSEQKEISFKYVITRPKNERIIIKEELL